MAVMANEKQSTIKISKELVSMAASEATLSVSGVNQEKGIKISKDTKDSKDRDSYIIDVFIIADFGVKIPQLAWDIQNSVKEAVETGTHLKVNEVNIHIQGVMMPREGRKVNVQKRSKGSRNEDIVSNQCSEGL